MTSLSGQWIVTEDFFGTPGHMRLQLEQNGSQLTGEINGDNCFWQLNFKGPKSTNLKAPLLAATFTVSVAHAWPIRSGSSKSRHRMPVEDSYIAATARHHGLTNISGNDKDFGRPGVKVFNPFKEPP